MTREEDLEKPQVEQMGAHHPADTTKSTPCSETGAGSMTDAQLVRFARAFRRGIVGPRGSSAQMCFAVCAPLEGLLATQGVDARLRGVDFMAVNHYWLELPDGRILDPTADQFGLEPVYLGPVPERYQRWMAEHARFVGQAAKELRGEAQ